MADNSYLVVPFERQGCTLAASRVLVLQAMAQARHVAQSLAPRVAGVAIIERRQDQDTGDNIDRLIADIGAVPPQFLERPSWSVQLN